MITFDQALSKTQELGDKPHLLLGNGFSRACRDDLFAYSALYDKASFAALSAPGGLLFDALNTRDFERAMQALQVAATVIKVYSPEQADLLTTVERDAEGLKEALVRAIAGNHPSRPNDIAPDAYAACRKFLSNFNRIYTLNYDLLLYWAVMQTDIPPMVFCDDGFRQDSDALTSFITWDPTNRYRQTLYFVHGGLHLFDSGTKLEKYTWTNTQAPLMDQIRKALDSNRYPVFVAEGSSDSKLERIRHQAYLSAAERSLVAIQGTLFLYGISMADTDSHVLRMIESNKVHHLFVSIYGDPKEGDNQRIIERTRGIAKRRRRSDPLDFDFYDAGSARVWG